ncbi:unnamed protein product [Rotaria sordida]|uniref:MULE transposase domain-containing protein n=1 Tax=Rotaria sordida TaxID=392033 RepID=A0A815H0F7_9BILA|nr:unnamed protein product [Rotaria sordida]CAF1598958.1 unnamed protein product [Rotaria sordida]
MSQIEKLLSVKGKPMIHHEGYIYTVERTASTKLIFRCQNRDCKARCHTNLSMDVFLSQLTAHCHAPQPNRVPAIQLKNEIKARAVTTDESTSSIIHSALRTYPLSAAGELSKKEALMLMIRRQRTVEAVDADGCLPEKLRKAYRDEDFILHEDKNLIIFTTKTNLSILKQNKHWFADGTFKVCPDNYYQLFTLHAMMTNAIIPLVYGLLIGKSAEDYNSFFEKVLVQDNFQPESIMTDFETGTIKSVREMLPNVLHKGCFFHFSQAIWQQVQEKGLVTKYREDEYFRLNVKKLITLAFVPVDEITTGFDLIANQFDDDADDLLDYFEKTWIREPKRRGTGRKKPKFDHKLWNIHDRVVAAVPRSNNSKDKRKKFTLSNDIHLEIYSDTST